jgi:hypothetical protein
LRATPRGKGGFNAGLKPTIKETPRNPHPPKGGRNRFFDELRDKLRFTVERPFAGEAQCKRLVLRFETKQLRPLGFNLLAFTPINLGEFCGH